MSNEKQQMLDDKQGMIRTTLRNHRKWGNTRRALKEYNDISEQFAFSINELDEIKNDLPRKVSGNEAILDAITAIGSRLDKLEAAPK